MVKLLHKLYTKHKKGFTLFEVLVVVVIMSVLAVIAIPTYNKLIKKSRVTDGLNVLNMLAGAQNKYFIEHGHYAQSLTSLNAPLKEYRVLNSTNPYTDIVTTNFTYDKVFTQHCIRAKANIGGRYTLIKNYKTKDKVVCLGRGCSAISDFVDEITHDDYPFLCPNEIECTLDQQQCGEEHFFEDTCTCACKETDYQNCVSSGGIFVQSTCTCAHLSSSCFPDGAILGGAYTGESCNYTGAIPDYANHTPGGDNSQGKEPEQGRGTGPGTPPTPQTYVCGMKYNQRVCRDHVWTDETICVYKGLYCKELGKVLDPVTCDCITPCDPDNKPACASAGGYTTCDPCPNAPGIQSIIEEMLQGNNGPHCFHCGYIPSGVGEPICDTETGQWHCPGATSGTCTEVSGNNIQPYINCSGASLGGTPGNTCGQKDLLNTRCWQEVLGGIPSLDPIYSETCNLKQGNTCFTGQTRPCTLPGGGPGIENCVDCNWDNNCVPAGCSAPNACTPGSTQSCTLPDGSQGTQTCDENCTWDECNGGCDPAEKPTGYGYQACHTKNGVTDPDLYCGTQKTNKSICVNNQWEWDFSEAECENVNERPPLTPVQCPGNICKVRESITACTLSANQYWWNHAEWTECHLKSNANCDTVGQILVGDDYSFSPIFCSEFCRAAKCKQPYFYNRRMRACYTFEYKTAVINTVTPPTPNNSNATGTVHNFMMCGPVNQNTNYNSQQCLRTCVTNDDIVTRTTNFDNGEDYCFNTDTALPAVYADPSPVTVNVCSNSLPNNRKWNKGQQYPVIKCKKANLNNYEFVSYP